MRPDRIIFLAFLFFVSLAHGQALRGDSVQSVLYEFSVAYPHLVDQIPETGRWHLKVPRSETVTPEQLTRLQDAFYYDIAPLCRIYGYKYLADWRALASKAARETFWGTSYLCNRTNNYFGIRHKAKPWICESFNFCESVVRNDPEPSDFASFPNFEASLWMFIHTMYSAHFLERLPDQGGRIVDVIVFERMNGIHYWERTSYGITLCPQVQGQRYSAEELIYTWSEHPINNLCVDCSRASDREWVFKLIRADMRTRG
ncbi:MAG: glucosaminidase domain-containing protein [Phaeodactylibacter sp.]|nr:glucosaminidase domain-containing protein [Phaeodactylibacter sp.]MCB9285756.1 glucosaminidase domain-containing protein [Lewinellaceae bacterium]